MGVGGSCLTNWASSNDGNILAGAHARTSACMNAHRERLSHRALLVREVGRQGEAEVRRVVNVLQATAAVRMNPHTLFDACKCLRLGKNGHSSISREEGALQLKITQSSAGLYQSWQRFSLPICQVWPTSIFDQPGDAALWNLQPLTRNASNSKS